MNSMRFKTGIGLFDKEGVRKKNRQVLAAYVGLYFTVITLTTVGFGDISPNTDGGKAFACLLMLVGIPLFGNALGKFSAELYGKEEAERHLQMVRGLDSDKF